MKTFCLLALICSSALYAATPKSAKFFQPTTLALPAPPAGIAIADINNDGFPDIITTNRPLGSGTGTNTTISVLLNKGNGKFQTPLSFTVGANPSEVQVTDVNGDGFPDLVIVCASGASGNGDVEVLLGRGDGSFANPVVIGTQFSAPLAVEDLNGDGKPDILVEGLNGIVIFLGVGDGTFTKLPANPSCLADAPFAVGDFNGDGKPDVAALCFAQGSLQNVQVLLGRGDGTFSAGQRILDIGTNVQGGGVVAAKFTGSANVDLAISITGPAGPPPTSGNLFIYAGDGHGNFTPSGSFPALIHPKAPIAGDFNGDGHPDIAVPNLACDSLSIYLNDGTGNFSGPVAWTVGAFPVEVAVGDLNLDGFMDLVVTDNGNSTVAVLSGSGKGTFNTPVALNASVPLVTNLTALGVAVADFNNDGFPDIATSAGAVLLADGLGGFHDAVQVTPTKASIVLTATLTSSSAADIILGSGPQLTVLLGNGFGAFPQTVTTTLPGNVHFVLTGDFNGDGATDLVVLTGQPSGTSGAYLYLGTYTGSFQTPTLIAPGNYLTAAAGLFHKNEALSIVLVAEPVGGISTALILQGNGNGTFEAPLPMGTGLASISAILAADLNSDGKPDLILAGINSAGANEISILLGTGKGTFQTPKATSALPLPIPAIAVADLNGDGKLDIAASQANSVVFFLSAGSGTFVKQAGSISVPGGNSLAAAKFIPQNGSSLVVGNAAPDSIWTLLNKTR